MEPPKMKYSDNPYIDDIVYYTKYLIVNSIVKDEVEADNNETLTSIKNGAKYVYSVKYDKHPLVGYLELNRYYATLWGQPPVPTAEEILATAPELENGQGYSDIDITIYADSYYIPMSPYQYILDESGVQLDITSKFYHTLTETELYTCRTVGICDMVEAEYGDNEMYKYIYHVDKKIDPATSRTASKFQLLYVPQLPDTDYNDLRSKFEIIYEKNKRYLLTSIYTEAMAFQNPYYDKFMTIFLKVLTMNDMVNDVFDYLIHKDVFDSRTIRYMFESYGVTYWSDIPTRYQIAMIKNMNTLLKYKSTNRNIVDICNLFGFDDITVFKYYLLKTHVTDQPIQFDENGNEDFSQGYDLEFCKIPIDGKIDDYIDNPEYREPYHEITDNDPYWLGINQNLCDVYTNNDLNIIRSDVKNTLLNLDFTCEATKYFSIDSTGDVASTSIDLCYFFNMLYDKDIEEFTIDLPDYISVDPVPVGQVFAYMTALGYVYNNIEDDIISNDFEKELFIYGFDFSKRNLTQIINEVKAKYTTLRDDFSSLEDGGEVDLINNYKFPPTIDPYTYEVFEDIFLSNRDIHDQLIELMADTDNYKVFKGYETIYDALMTTQCSLEYFGKLYGDGFDRNMTYTEWFEKVNYPLAKSIMKCKAMTNIEKRTIEITEIFDDCVYALKQVLTNERFDEMYKILPTKSADFLVRCIVKVITFFKSYKAQFLSSSSMFQLKDSDNQMGMLEDTKEHYRLEIPQTMSMLEYPEITFINEIHDNDSVGTFDKVYVKITSTN